tara:strand:+ start:6305 stop:7402 length:1098 start_codon:yes stop_codon:yes gene_type:complete
MRFSKNKKKKILIGFVNQDFSGPIPTITKSFVDGLSWKYDFKVFHMNRSKYNLQRKFNFINIFYFIIHYLSWINYIVKFKPDIVHFPVTSYWNLEKSLFFLKTARTLGAKVVIGHLHGGSFNDFWNNLKEPRKSLAKRWLESLDHFIVLGQFWKNFFNDKVNFKSISIVNNPIDINFEKSFNDFSRDYSKNSCLFVGSIGMRKGCYDIVDSFKKFPIDNIVNIVGPEEDVGDIKKIKNLINENNIININIKRSAYGLDKINYFKNNGIFLFPSHNENLPLVIIEAACASLPIITTPVGALPEFFTHLKDIYFIEPGNISDIKKAIDFFNKYPDKRLEIGREARNTFEVLLSRDKIIDQLDKVYSS